VADTTQDSIHGCLAQALPWPPFQTAELNALARRNPTRTGLPPAGSRQLRLAHTNSF
jgi:hypothetical protein